MWSLRKINKLLVCQKVIRRSYYTPVIENTEGCSTPHSRGLVLGVYSNETDKFDDGILTQTASQYDEVFAIFFLNFFSYFNIENYLFLYFFYSASNKRSFIAFTSNDTNAKTWRISCFL